MPPKRAPEQKQANMVIETIACPKFFSRSLPINQNTIAEVPFRRLDIVIALLNFQGPSAAKLVLCRTAQKAIKGTIHWPESFAPNRSRNNRSPPSSPWQISVERKVCFSSFTPRSLATRAREPECFGPCPRISCRRPGRRPHRRDNLRTRHGSYPCSSSIVCIPPWLPA